MTTAEHEDDAGDIKPTHRNTGYTCIVVYRVLQTYHLLSSRSLFYMIII